MAPGWKKEWHIGVRVTATKKLIAVITAIPCQTRVYDKFVVSAFFDSTFFFVDRFRLLKSTFYVFTRNFARIGWRQCWFKRFLRFGAKKWKFAVAHSVAQVTRRVHLVGTFQAVYTAGVVLPKPIAACRFAQLFVVFRFSQFFSLQLLASIAQSEKIDWNQI